MKPRDQQVVLVGQAPGPRTAGKGAFDGPSGDRLARLAALGRGRAEVREKFWCMNVLDPMAAEDATGEPLSKRHGPALARRLLPVLAGRVVIFAGFDVVDWFRTLRRNPIFRWRRGRLETGAELVYAVIPHPSGLNRAWNDAETATAGARFLHTAARLDVADLLEGRSELLDADDRRLGPVESPREALWDTERAAEYLNVEPERIRRWVCKRTIPHVRLSRGVVRFRRSDLDAHLARAHVPLHARAR